MAAAPAAFAAPTEAERRLNFCKVPNVSPILPNADAITYLSVLTSTSPKLVPALLILSTFLNKAPVEVATTKDANVLASGVAQKMRNAASAGRAAVITWLTNFGENELESAMNTLYSSLDANAQQEITRQLATNAAAAAAAAAPYVPADAAAAAPADAAAGAEPVKSPSKSGGCLTPDMSTMSYKMSYKMAYAMAILVAVIVLIVVLIGYSLWMRKAQTQNMSWHQDAEPRVAFP